MDRRVVFLAVAFICVAIVVVTNTMAVAVAAVVPQRAGVIAVVTPLITYVPAIAGALAIVALLDNNQPRPPTGT